MSNIYKDMRDYVLDNMVNSPYGEMIKRLDIKEVTAMESKTYSLNNGFYVDIVKNSDKKYPCYDIWLYHKDYGIKDYIFGTPLEYGFSYEEIIQHATDFLLRNDCFKTYAVDYMDDDCECYSNSEFLS